MSAGAAGAPHPYRLGLAVKILGGGGLATHDTRRWGSGPHLSRSIELLGPAFDYLERIDVTLYRLSSQVIPYGTHPDLPQFDYRRQIAECAGELAALGERSRQTIDAGRDEGSDRELLGLERVALKLRHQAQQRQTAYARQG